MKREKRLRRARILEGMKQTEVSVLLLGKITRNFHCSFLLQLYVFSFLSNSTSQGAAKVAPFFDAFSEVAPKVSVRYCLSSESSLFIILILTATKKQFSSYCFFTGVYGFFLALYLDGWILEMIEKFGEKIEQKMKKGVVW